MKKEEKSYLDVELSRERRLWIKEIRNTVTPIIIVGGIIFKDKDNREAFKKAYNKVENKIKSLFN